jgi:hypothetical protein
MKTQEETIMENPAAEYLKAVALGRKQSYRNLEVYPLFSAPSATLTYLILDEALEEDGVWIGEVDEAGTVSELKVINRADCPILILDGEELVGAKQNRIVNTTLLVDAKSEIRIPVSCVEQGRWAFNTPVFHSKKRLMSSALRARKSVDIQCSLRRNGTFMSDQGAIWSDIAQKAKRMAAESPSMAMERIYEKEAPRLRDYTGRFRCMDRQSGAIFAINGRVLGAELLGRPDTFAKHFKKIIESYALDAIDAAGSKEVKKSRRRDATALLNDIGRGRLRTYPSVAMGTDVRIESRRLAGFALVVDNQVLHLSVFAKMPGENMTPVRTSRLARFSRRRRQCDS